MCNRFNVMYLCCVCVSLVRLTWCNWYTLCEGNPSRNCLYVYCMIITKVTGELLHATLKLHCSYKFCWLLHVSCLQWEESCKMQLWSCSCWKLTLTSTSQCGQAMLWWKSTWKLKLLEAKLTQLPNIRANVVTEANWSQLPNIWVNVVIKST